MRYNIIDIIKGKELPIGTIRKWKNGTFIKTPMGWKPVKKRREGIKYEKVEKFVRRRKKMGDNRKIQFKEYWLSDKKYKKAKKDIINAYKSTSENNTPNYEFKNKDLLHNMIKSHYNDDMNYESLSVLQNMVTGRAGIRTKNIDDEFENHLDKLLEDKKFDFLAQDLGYLARESRRLAGQEKTENFYRAINLEKEDFDLLEEGDYIQTRQKACFSASENSAQAFGNKLIVVDKKSVLQNVMLHYDASICKEHMYRFEKEITLQATNLIIKKIEGHYIYCEAVIEKSIAKHHILMTGPHRKGKEKSTYMIFDKNMSKSKQPIKAKININGNYTALTDRQKHKLIKTIEKSLYKSIDNNNENLIKKPVGEGGRYHWNETMRFLEEKVRNFYDFKELIFGLCELLGIPYPAEIKELKKSIITGLKKAVGITSAQYKPDGVPFSPKELYIIDEFIKEYFNIWESAKIIAIRTYMISRLNGMDDYSGNYRLDYENLSMDYKKLAQKYNITKEDINSMIWGEIEVGQGIQRMSDKTRNRVQEIILDHKKHGSGGKSLAQRLWSTFSHEDSEGNRDWERIAITETNRLGNNGRLGNIVNFKFVKGVSHNDACNWCLEHINGQVLIKLPGPLPKYDKLPPESDKYRELDTLWNNTIWQGKDTLGQPMSPRKRMYDPDTGKTVLVRRLPHELKTPGDLCHIAGRCTWLPFDPEHEYINEEGNIRSKYEDPVAWEEYREHFYKNKMPLLNMAKKYY